MSSPTPEGLALGGKARCVRFTNSSITCGCLSGSKCALYLRTLLTFYNSAVGPITYTLFSEIASPRLRSRTIGLGLVVQNLFGLTLNLLIPYLITYAPIFV